MNQNIRRKYPYLLLFIAIALYIVGLLILPDVVVLQGNLETGEVTKSMPTALAMLIPLAFMGILNILQIRRDAAGKKGYMAMYLSLLGFIMYIVLYALNIKI